VVGGQLSLPLVNDEELWPQVELLIQLTEAGELAVPVVFDGQFKARRVEAVLLSLSE
jgi:hypothetical protein